MWQNIMVALKTAELTVLIVIWYTIIVCYCRYFAGYNCFTQWLCFCQSFFLQKLQRSSQKQRIFHLANENVISCNIVLVFCLETSQIVLHFCFIVDDNYFCIERMKGDMKYRTLFKSGIEATIFVQYSWNLKAATA